MLSTFQIRCEMLSRKGFAINVMLGGTSDPGWGQRVLQTIIVLTSSVGVIGWVKRGAGEMEKNVAQVPLRCIEWAGSTFSPLIPLSRSEVETICLSTLFSPGFVRFSIATGGMYWIATIWGIQQISPFSLIKCWKSDLSGCQLSVSYVVWNRFIFFLSLSQLLKLTAFGTVPRWSQIKIFYEMVQTNTLACSPSYVDSSLLSVPTCPSCIYSISCLSLYSCHVTTWVHVHLFNYFFCITTPSECGANRRLW